MQIFKVVTVGAAASVILAFLLLSGAYVRAAEPALQSFDIGPQALATALNEFARQSHEEIFFTPEVVSLKRSSGVHGVMEPTAALKILLKDLGLSFSITPAGAVVVGTAGVSFSPQTTSAPPTAADSSRNIATRSSLQLAQAPPGPSAGAAAVAEQRPSTTQQDAVLQEVIVTAQKREERLRDVPVPVTAINAQALVESNLFRLQDYYQEVPGLNFSQDSRGGTSIAIRGVTTGAYVTPTTGITIDDVPYGSSNVIAAYSPTPEVDPDEIARIEVLRGPQGTLYGASSIGGLIKYVTIDPSTDALSGRIQIGGSTIRNGPNAGYNVSGAINVPLSDTLAIRANGFTHKEPGYIDNVLTGQRGANDVTTDGARLAALWRPSESANLKVSALVQRTRSDGSSEVEILPGLSDLQQSYLGGFGGYDRKLQAYSANLTARIGAAEFTSITGYSKADVAGSFDLSALLGNLTNNLFGVGGVGWAEDNTTKKVTQEFRLSMPLGGRLDWLFGVFYTHENMDAVGGQVLVNPVTFVRGLQAELQQLTQTYQEYAAFTDLTFKITNRFDVQVGGRESHNNQAYEVVTSGPLVPVFFSQPSPLIAPEADSSDNSFTYLVTPRLKLTPAAMLYARFASGYRPGGPNDVQDPTAPRSFAPDKTQNYEFGTKDDFLDHRLSLDASVFHILWRDIQLSLNDAKTGVGYTGNGSRAKSDGVEVSVDAKPLDGMSVSTWVVWNNAVLTEPLPPGFPGIAAVGAAGDRLPYSSKFSASASVRQEFPLWNEVQGFTGATLSYVGAREGEFASSPQRQIYPAYAKVDVHAGVKYGPWRGSAFVTNLADRRGVLDGGLGLAEPFAFHVIQPRTVGLNVYRLF